MTLLHRLGLALTAIALGACSANPAPTVSTAPADATPVRAARPIPYPVVPPPEFSRAVEAGTRTRTGAPGPRYWRQWSEYDLTARVDPATRRLDGTARIIYHNRSPDPLASVYLHLFQNLHAPGALRNEMQEITGGVTLDRFAVNGTPLAALTSAAPTGTGYRVSGTLLAVRLPQPLAPGDRLTIDAAWHFTVPQSGAGRMGWSGDDLFHVAYWYPQMAVYDDVGGWHVDPYLGVAEFYTGFGSYRLAVEVPEEWLVTGTGALENPDAVLTPAALARLRRAEASDSVVTVAAVGELGAGRTTRDVPSNRHTWRFAADTVRDAAFSLTRRSQWDAMRTPVGDRDGDGRADHARIDAFWRAPATRWAQAARYGAHAIDFLSRWTGVPYPWPHMSLIEGAGIIDGGMEFPMLTLIGDYTQRGDSALYNVVAHELAHMWVPMIVGTDETRRAWMDEGTTTFNENQARREFYPGPDHGLGDVDGYLELARAGGEGELMRWSNHHYDGWAYGIASYSKPATALRALRAVIGDEAFAAGLRTFMREWRWGHPQPWDLFNTFERAAGQDLGWFWRSWYYETWTLDHAVLAVEAGADGTRIVIEDRGLMPMPVRLAITRADGTVERREIPVSAWLDGSTRAEVTVPGTVTRVEIDPERIFPDIDRENNRWQQQ